jgi:hypothetical protein
MDEFHYYSDRARGVAWQVPLISLPHTRFLLMSATLGDVRTIAGHLERQTVHPVAVVQSAERPVPLEFEYRETPLLDTLERLHAAGRTPAYVVSFTQRDCAELAQSLTSRKLATREERAVLREAAADFRFDSPYGKELRRLIGFGIGVHHAGLLPKYRLLVEQLSQRGLLQVICGTDTLGVGVNIPIRTVVFTQLAKFDGRKVGILAVRDFQQIAGRAGRKGFDDRGWVVCQAPEQVIEKRKAERAGKAKAAKRKGPRKGDVSWTEETFESLVRKPPETLRSRFRVDHSMVLSLLQRDAELDDPSRRNFASLREIIAACHESEGRKERLLGDAARLVHSLYRAGLLRMTRDAERDYLWVTIDEELQREFSMHQPLSLYLVESLGLLAPDAPEYPLQVLTLVEAILEDPKAILYQQEERRKRDLLGRLKAEGVPYEERMAQLDGVSWPKPDEDLVYRALEAFRSAHPAGAGASVSPKGVGREIWENYWSFKDFVELYGLKRSEGVLLRYLSQLYKTLVQNVPETAKTAGIYDLEGFLRALLEHTDTSLLEEWESLLHPELRSRRTEERESARRALRNWELFHDPRVFTARVRAELHLLVRALSRRDWEEAAAAVRATPDDPWDAARFEAALAPFYERYGELLFTGEARLADRTQVEKVAPRCWQVRQLLLDPESDDLWHIAGEVDLSGDEPVEGPLVRVVRIGT